MIKVVTDRNPAHSGLRIDCQHEERRICEALRASLRHMRRKGFVIGVSGGVDSTVTLALCTAAVGSDRVLAIQMPERQSAPETLGLSALAAQHFGVRSVLEDITAPLESVGFYRRYDESVRMAVPEYADGWRSKIVLPNVANSNTLSVYFVVAEAPDGRQIKKRLSHEAYLGILAATNFKQRVRKMLEYYHADRLNFAVAGTPNRLEYDQGFFVKLGDGAADIKPIAHLYKTQVYQLAEHLGVPRQIRSRPPTTDTYSLPQGQDEFYFSLPYEQMDTCLYARTNGLPASEIAPTVGLSVDQVERIYRDIDRKRMATRYLHLPPQLVEQVPAVTP